MTTSDTTATDTIACRHVGQMDTLMLLNSRATSAASTAGHIHLYNELLAECQDACGDQSPYRDADPLPEPVYCSGRYGLPEMVAEVFVEPMAEFGRGLGELASAGMRRLRRRGPANQNAERPARGDR